MSEETKQGIVLAVATVALALTIAVGAVKCGAGENTAIIECVKAGKPPLECRAAVAGSNR